jgi:hypothetical protein
LDGLGYAVAGFPTDVIRNAYGAMKRIAQALAAAPADNTPNFELHTAVPYLTELYELIGTPDIEKLALKFAASS